MTYYVYRDWDSYRKLVLNLPKDHEGLGPNDTGYKQNPYDSPVKKRPLQEEKEETVIE